MKKLKPHRRELIDFLSRRRLPRATAALLEDLLTPQEFRSIAERLQIMKNLAAGKTHRRIARQLKVSISKVTRGSRVLQFGKMDWKKVFSPN